MSLSFEKSLELAELIGARAGAAICAFNLGNAYKNVSALRDLDQAEHWYRRSLKLTGEQNRLRRGRCLAALGNVALERLKDARANKAGEDELLRHLNEAAGFYYQQLELTPADAVFEMATVHNQLGVIYGDAGDVDRALSHFRESIHYKDKRGDLYDVSTTRFNVALSLALAGRLQDALVYAQAALRGFESYGESAADMIQRTRQLMEQIQQSGRR